MNRLIPLLLLLVFLALPGTVRAAEKVPTRITADNLQYSQDHDSVTFTGDVHVVRGEMRLWADKLTTYLDKKGGQGTAGKGNAELASDANITRIVALGNVRMEHEGREGYCGKAVYDVERGVLSMHDDPVVIDGQNKLQGEVIKFYAEENRSEVIGGSKRVEALFFTDDKKLGGEQGK
ncbi:LptA/OstA family protein [Desulfohalovibrio reitneri]|uniref:LptA/OstA family protein n=1 Tax=Desulfohalovibrio reitneri TaxID=1307759 RepID=UPI000558666E|nr:LptA/OstA family protein [Desulfohalovibrio reitneri]